MVHGVFTQPRPGAATDYSRQTSPYPCSAHANDRRHGIGCLRKRGRVSSGVVRPTQSVVIRSHQLPENPDCLRSAAAALLFLQLDGHRTVAGSKNCPIILRLQRIMDLFLFPEPLLMVTMQRQTGILHAQSVAAAGGSR